MESSQQPPPPGSTTSEPVDLATTNPYSLHQAVYARRAEYVRPHRIRVKIGTWNVAACPGTDKDLAGWFVSGRGLDAALTSLDLSDNPVVEKDGPVSPSTDAVGEHAVHLVGGDKVGLYVLGLQEVVDLNTPAYMARVYAADHGPVGKWRDALDSALPPGYQLIVAEQMSGILLFVYASPDVVPTISNVSSTSVGTGVLGYLGNKGAVVTRLILGDSTRMLFVNCHLASGNEASYVERRIWDVGTILSRAQFKPASIAGVSEDDPEKIGDEDFAFWLGDLNFRLDGIPSDDIRHLLMLHSRGEYDLSKRGLPREDSLEGEGVVVSSEGSEETTDREPTASSSRARAQDDDDSEFLPDPDDFVPDPHEDPASLQATLDSLLPHDQLKRVIRQRKIFHDGWREGPITFLPTYKYDVGTVGLFDSSEKRRAPSWCDRILYRSRKDKEDFEKKIKEEEDARKKDEEMRARGIDHAAEEDEVLFDYGPDPDDDNQPQESPGLDYDEYDDGEEGNVDQIVTKEGFNDKIHLDIYTSHQRITSSDHKPISSVFTLDYDAVVPELKAKVHAEVARELDRAENEGRPGITVVVDHPNPHSSEQSDRHGDPPEHLVDFGEVRFMKKETSTLTLANTGRVPATFLFVEKPTTGDPDNSTLLQWLTASFIRPEPSGDEPESFELGKEVTLEPGETVQALLEASVSEISHARMLNDGEASLEEVLVLRVTDGRDHFIPIRGTWAPTCIGRSIDELIRIPEGGIRKLAKALLEKKVRAGPIPYDLDVHSAAPRELFRFTEAIETLTERALADEQMVEDCRIPKDAGWPFEESTWKSSDGDSRASLVVDIIDALDHDRPISDAFAPETSCIQRLEAVGEALLLFLRGLTDGPSAAASRPPPGADFEADKTTILDILSTTPNHNICFVFLTATLAKIVAELSPLSRAELEALKADSGSRVMGVLGRRSLSFRRGGTSPAAEAAAAFERRQTRERRFAEVFGRAICRAPVPERERDKKLVEDRERAIVELFLRRRGDS